MKFKTILLASVLSVASMGASAAVSGGISGGVSGGVSGGLGIDFAAGNVAGSNMSAAGGLAVAIDAAFKKKKK